MNRTTKFTQTKFKERPPPPVPKPTKRHKKRCAPPVPDEGTNEARTSGAYSPPPPPADLKDFLVDVAQEVVITKPVDIIDHLADYTTNLQAQLKAREQEAIALKQLMEEKARRLIMEEHASRVIQTAFRSFRLRKKKERGEMFVKKYLAKGMTLERANKAAICIQRHYRRHTMNLRIQLKLQLDAARQKEDTSPYCRVKKRDEATSILRMLKQIDVPVEKAVSVKELYGPNTPYNANGEKVVVDPPCPMAAPLLANQPKTENKTSIEETNSKLELTDQAITDLRGDANIEEAKDTNIGSSEEAKTDETGDAVKSGLEEVQGQEDAATPAPSSETKADQDEAEPEQPGGSVTKVPSGEKNDETSNVPEEALPQPTEEQPAGEEKPQDVPVEENPVTEPPPTEAPTVDNEAQ